MKQETERGYRQQFHALSQFLGGYFYQGWTEEYKWKEQQPDFEPVVHFYKVKNPSATVAKATSELEKFLGLPLDDETFNKVVSSEFGVNYNTFADNLTKRQWLEKILQLLKQPISSDTPVLEMT